MSLLILHAQFAQAEPGVFILQSEPNPYKSCIGTIAKDAVLLKQSATNFLHKLPFERISFASPKPTLLPSM